MSAGRCTKRKTTLTTTVLLGLKRSTKPSRAPRGLIKLLVFLHAWVGGLRALDYNRDIEIHPFMPSSSSRYDKGMAHIDDLETAFRADLAAGTLPQAHFICIFLFLFLLGLLVIFS